MRKVLFIDYDDTLHDTNGKFTAEFHGIYGLSSDKILESYLHVHLNIVHPNHPEMHDDFFFHQKLLCDYLAVPYVEEEARSIARKFEEVHQGRWLNPSFFPDTFPFLDIVHKESVLCLTTGDYAEEKAESLEKAAGKKYFRYAFDHTHLGIKGEDQYFINALMSTNTLAHNAVVIGDSLEQDISTGKKAGITTIWLNRRQLAREHSSPTPDFEANDLFEVLRILRLLKK